MCKYCNVGERLREAQDHPETCNMSKMLVDILQTGRFIFEFTGRDKYHYVLAGDGSVFQFTPKCRKVTAYLATEGKTRKRFKYCPYCGRRL